MNKEARQKMEVLKSIGEKELWLVENHITSETEKASTFLWVVYKSRDRALDWIKYCSICCLGEDYSGKIKELQVGESDTVSWNFTDEKQNKLIDEFVVTYYCGDKES